MHASAQYLREELSQLRRQLRELRVARGPIVGLLSLCILAGVVLLGDAIYGTTGAIVGAVIAVSIEIEAALNRLEFNRHRRKELLSRIRSTKEELALQARQEEFERGE